MAKSTNKKCTIGPVRKHVKTRISSNSYVFKWEIENVSLLETELSSDYFSPFPKCQLICKMNPNSSCVTLFSNSYEGTSLTCILTVCDSTGKILFSETGSYTHTPFDYDDYDGIPDDTGYDPEVVSGYLTELNNLKSLPNDVLVIICRIYDDASYEVFHQQISNREVSTPLDYLKRLATDLTDSSLPSFKEKINLCVGYETEEINKSVLSAKSPVFKKMLQNLQPEKHDNSLAIPDFNISVVRSLVKFLNSGIIPTCDDDHLSDLYNAAVEYEIQELRNYCSDQLASNISLKNVCGILFLSDKYNDNDLKMYAITFLRDNLETVLKSSEWQCLMCEEPQTALEAIRKL